MKPSLAKKNKRCLTQRLRFVFIAAYLMYNETFNPTPKNRHTAFV